MILFLKSLDDDGDTKMPLHEKLILVFKDRVKDAKTDQDRARAQRDLDKLEASTSAQ